MKLDTQNVKRLPFTMLLIAIIILFIVLTVVLVIILIEENKTQNAIEKVNLAVSQSKDENGINIDRLINNLNYIEKIDKNTIEKELPMIVSVDGIKIEIDVEGNVQSKQSNKKQEAIPGKVVLENTKYISGNDVAIIPQGFYVSLEQTEQSIDKGLVVIAPDGSEFVWVPVDKNTLCADNTKGKEMAKLQENSKEFYEGIFYEFSKNNDSTISSFSTQSGLGTVSSREPSLITGSDDGYTWNIAKQEGKRLDANSDYYNNILGFDSLKDFGVALNEEYTSIINSIKTYGGFYIGRYESSLSNTKNTDTNSATTGHIQSKPGVIPTSANNSGTFKWYGLYKSQKEYVNNIKGIDKNLKSTMVTGSCYDAILNWALNGEDSKKITITGNGNHSGNVTTTASKLYENDKINNIYDLEGNLREWTSEANSARSRVYRGGCYNNTYSPSFRDNNFPDYNNSSDGSRILLYL